MRTYSVKPADVKRAWHLIDANGQVLGRLSVQAADLLIGKGKTSYTPHVDGGDFVVVINAQQIMASGSKMQTKNYYRHSGYPGGIRQTSLGEQMEADPEGVITRAVRGMIPANKLRKGRLARLKVYGGSDHPHSGQLAQPPGIEEKKGSDK